MGMIVSLEDCQTEPAAMPMQNVIGNAIASKVCLSSNRHVTRNRSFFESVETFASAGTSVASTGGAQLSVELIGTFRLLADLTEYGHHHVTRPRREKSDREA